MARARSRSDAIQKLSNSYDPKYSIANRESRISLKAVRVFATVTSHECLVGCLGTPVKQVKPRIKVVRLFPHAHICITHCFLLMRLVCRVCLCCVWCWLPIGLTMKSSTPRLSSTSSSSSSSCSSSTSSSSSIHLPPIVTRIRSTP